MLTQKTEVISLHFSAGYYLFLVSLMFFTFMSLACKVPSDHNSSESNTATEEQLSTTNDYGLEFKDAPQIGQYIVEVFEDSRGAIWFGTLSKGVAKYDGSSLTYLTTEDGLSGNAIVSIVEDKDGILWFGTQSGLSRYDGTSFKNYTVKENLCDDRVSKLLIDQNDMLWIGTWGGVCQLDLKNIQAGITNFPLPVPDVVVPSYQETAEWVTDIIEHTQGDIWISRSGYSVCRFSSEIKQHGDEDVIIYTKDDGLPSNCAQVMHEDNDGKIWIGCRVAERDHPDAEKRIGAGGLSVYDPSLSSADQIFKQFPNIPGLHQSEVYTIYGDSNDNIWIGANGTGLYRFDGQQFDLFTKTDRPDVLKSINGIQSMLEDSRGALWVGCSGGLFRLEDDIFVNVTQDGPWK